MTSALTVDPTRIHPTGAEPIGVVDALLARKERVVLGMIAQGMSRELMARKMGEKPRTYEEAYEPPNKVRHVPAIGPALVREVTPTGGRPRDPDLSEWAALAITAMVEAIWEISAEQRHGWGMREIPVANAAMAALAEDVFGLGAAGIRRWLDLGQEQVMQGRVRHRKLMEKAGGYAEWYAGAHNELRRRYREVK